MHDFTRYALGGLGAALLMGAGCSATEAPPASRWTFTESSRDLVPDPLTRERMARALDAAEHSGTDPSLSGFRVRVATIVEADGAERIVLGGNSEYVQAPEAIHGETSVMNHAIALVGPEAARESVRFIAFYHDRCDGGGSCGDCRDYLITSTRYEDLLIACGQSTDRTVHVARFVSQVVPESTLPEVEAGEIGLPLDALQRLIAAATEARRGGVSLFTPPARHLGVAALSRTGKVYVAAGADDAAFHYRYPVGSVLQQAATARDYFIDAIVVAGEPGTLPPVSYRDRQYGMEFSSFNVKRGLAPIRVVLVDGTERYRLSTFEQMLPGAFSAADFMPDAVDRFLSERAPR